MKKLKKFLLLACSTLCLFLCACATSCKDNVDVGAVPPQENIELTLSATDIDLIVGDTARLTAWFTKEEGATLTYSVSNSEVISVDQEGNIEAKNAGDATITVSYGAQTKTCEVNVSFGNMVPMLSLKQVDTNSVTISLGESLNLESELTFNQKAYSDYTISYNIIGESGAIEDNVFVSKDLGTSVVNVVASWRGLSGETIVTMQKSISVEVIYSVAITTNQKEYVLYTVESFAGENYATQTDFSVSIDDNGERKAANSIEIVEGMDVIEYDAVENRIVALKYGVAKIRIEYTDKINEPHTKMIEVVVKRPVKQIEERIEFSSIDGTLPLAELFGEDVTLIEAYQDGKAITISADGKKISGLTMNLDCVTQSDILVYNDVVGVQVPINGYGKVIRTEADLKVFDIVDDDDKPTTQASTIIEGYFILANDIKNDPNVGANQHFGMEHNKDDKTSASYRPNWLGSSAAKVGFKGTFDGQGHTIATEVYQAGIFGVLQNGTVIKNVKIIPTFTNESKIATVIAMQAPWAAISEDAENTVVLDNVCVEISDFRTANNGSYTSGLVYYRSNGLKVYNSVVKIDSVVCNENTVASGALFAQDQRQELQTNYIRNVVVISNNPMFMAMDENTSKYNRNFKTVASTDVVKTGEEDNSSTVLDESYALKFAIGKCQVGQIIMTKGKTVASDGDNLNNLYRVENAFRYNSLSDCVSAEKASVGNWVISSNGITWVV